MMLSTTISFSKSNTQQLKEWGGGSHPHGIELQSGALIAHLKVKTPFPSR